MATVIKGEVLNIRYNPDVPSIPIQCATSIYFPTSTWNNDPRKRVSDSEASTYKVRIEGNIYNSDTIVSRNRFVVGNTLTWSSSLPSPLSGFQAIVDGDMYVSGRLVANNLGSSNISFGVKSPYAVDFQNTTTIVTGTKMGRLMFSNIRTYDMLSKKIFTVTNPEITYNESDEMKTSYVFLTVSNYTLSVSTPVVSVRSVTNGSFQLEISNFMFSPTTANISFNNGTMEIYFLII